MLLHSPDIAVAVVGHHEAAHVAPQPLHGRHEAQDVQLLVGFLLARRRYTSISAACEVRLGSVQRYRARVVTHGRFTSWRCRDVGEILRDVREVHVAAHLAVAASVAVEL